MARTIMLRIRRSSVRQVALDKKDHNGYDTTRHALNKSGRIRQVALDK